ncbi:MAG TPA: hypothetical protein VME46_11625, partial [Acidimicrobiales bacterium]|nr:hypothetical protein [Acidimicrobiales bacterium]
MKTGTPRWLDELTARTEAPWLHMGTRALHEVAFGAPTDDDGPGGPLLCELKARLLATAHDEVSVILPGAAVGAAEALAGAGEAAALVAGAARRALG